MAHDKSPTQSLLSQIVLGVVVSVLTALSLKCLGLVDPESRIQPTETASPAATVRISFAPPEPKIELPPPEALLFNCRQPSPIEVRIPNRP